MTTKDRYHSDSVYRTKILERNRQWQLKNKDKVRKYGRKHDIKRQVDQIEERLWNAARARSKRTGVDFNINVSDIVIPEKCPYLNVMLTREFGKGRTDFNPSVDRINNDLGYVVGNVRVISNLANAMKRNASENQLLIFAENIIKLHAN